MVNDETSKYSPDEDMKTYKLTKEQCVKLQKVREAFPKVDDDYQFLRFIKARKWDVQATIDRLKLYLKWFEETKVGDYNVDNILEGPPPYGNLFARLIPHRYHGFDKDHRPVYYEKTGTTPVSLALSLFKVEEYIDAHIWGMQYNVKRCKLASIKYGHNVDQFTTILDMKGISMDSKKGLNFLKACSALDEKYYPERLGKLFVVNAPWIFPALFKVAKLFIDPVTASKIKVLSTSNSTATLLANIDAKQLPKEYGGECECKGGCVPVHFVDKKSKYHCIAEYVTVPAAKSIDIVLETGDKKGKIEWFFKCDSDKRITYSVTEVDCKDAKVKTVLHKPERVIKDKKTVDVKGNSKITFTLDNTKSYWHGRYVWLYAAYIPEGEVDECQMKVEDWFEECEKILKKKKDEKKEDEEKEGEKKDVLETADEQPKKKEEEKEEENKDVVETSNENEGENKD